MSTSVKVPVISSRVVRAVMVWPRRVALCSQAVRIGANP
jgi:hypothetical protein